MIYKIIFALFLGLLISIGSLQYDSAIKNAIGKAFADEFERTLDCKMSYTIGRINFFYPTIELHDVCVTPSTGTGWRWTARRYITSFSWWHLLMQGTINLTVAMKDAVAHTDFDNGALAIMPHLKKMVITNPNVPIVAQEIALENAQFNITDHHKDQTMSICWDSFTQKTGSCLHTQMNIRNGHYERDGKMYFSIGDGMLTCNNSYTAANATQMKSTCNATIAHCFAKPLHCAVCIDWHDDAIICTFTNEAQKMFDAIIHFNQDFPQIQASISLQKLPMGSGNSIDISGTVTNKGWLFKGDFETQCASWASVKGTWEWDFEKQSGLATGSNTQSIELPHFLNCRVKPCDCTFELRADASGNCTGMYTALIDGALPCPCKGTFAYEKNNWQCTAVATLDAAAVRSLLSWHGYTISMEGAMQCHVLIENGNLIQVALDLEKGAVRIPHTYSCITGAHAIIGADISAKQIMIGDVELKMPSGSIKCNEAVLQLDAQNKIVSVHIPLLFQTCQFLFADTVQTTVSGALTARYIQEQLPHIAGYLLIDDAHIQEFLFSMGAKEPLKIPFDASLAIGVESIKPISIATNHMQVDGHLNMRVSNTINDPHVAGTVTCTNGILNLPYKPLYIERGIITFIPGQLQNPMIDLVARNTIKKYDISVGVFGFLKDYTVQLQSNPTLSENQIISLLLVGSAQESLNTIIPAVAMQSLKHYIFESEQSFALAKNTKQMLSSLSNVHLVPLFNDQTARGGLRAAFEIELGDRVRALIQKNFTLTEDTRFEAEYLLSDDIILRGVRDERRDANAEVEMRWKF